MKRQEVEEFLAGFATALTSGDTKRLGTMWETPALVISDDSVRLVSTIGEVEDFFAGAKSEYAKIGVTDTRADIKNLNFTTDKIAIVDVDWPYLDVNGNQKGSESSTYTLRRGDDGALKIRTIAMHGVSKDMM